MKRLWVLVGGNGAGKSTFYQHKLKPLGLPFINADDIAREVYPEDPEGNSYKAAQIAESTRAELILQGTSFCFETVFSHPSKIDFIANAKALGYQVTLVFIHVESPEINIARVSQRVRKGGHDVPDEKVEARIPRTMKHVKMAIPLCDLVQVLDNSSSVIPFRPILAFKRGVLSSHAEELPDWARRLL